jgi:hypothetical protein
MSSLGRETIFSTGRILLIVCIIELIFAVVKTCAKNIFHIWCFQHVHGHNSNVTVSCHLHVDSPVIYLNCYSVTMLHNPPFAQNKYGYAWITILGKELYTVILTWLVPMLNVHMSRCSPHILVLFADEHENVFRFLESICFLLLLLSFGMWHCLVWCKVMSV